MHLLRLSALSMALALLGCDAGSSDGDSPARTAAAAEPAPTTEAIDWSQYRLDLFSQSLHDIPIPEAGHARVEMFGQVFESELRTDCSTPTEPPVQENDWDDHRFQLDFQIWMDETYANVTVLRRVIPEHYEGGSGPIEMENLTIRTMERGGQTLDIRNHSLSRLGADRPPRITRAYDQRPEPAASPEEVPGIRIHPDGRRVTFVGELGRGETIENSDYRDLEEIRIAIHCGQER